MKLSIQRDEANEWRWSLKSGNGSIVAISGEGYVKLATLEKIVRKYVCRNDEKLETSLVKALAKARTTNKETTK